jgi:hypothetical protein
MRRSMLPTGAASDGFPSISSSSGACFTSRPPVFTNRCCKLVNDHDLISFGSTSCRHRLPKVYSITPGHSRTCSCDRCFVLVVLWGVRVVGFKTLPGTKTEPYVRMAASFVGSANFRN